MNSVLIIKKDNCIACDILESTIKYVIRNYYKDVKLKSIHIDDIDEEDRIKYISFGKFPISVFARDNTVVETLFGTQSKHKIFDALESLYW